MPEYLHPGVYIEETSYRGKPIQGVSTSTAGFVGAARKGAEGRATFVPSFAHFRRLFGDPVVFVWVCVNLFSPRIQSILISNNQ